MNTAGTEPDCVRETVTLFEVPITEIPSECGLCQVHCVDTFDWLEHAPENCVHAVVTDPPYGLVEYTQKELDPFMGSGSTIAAATACDLHSIGLEVDQEYFEMAKQAIPRLAHVNPTPMNGN